MTGLVVTVIVAMGTLGTLAYLNRDRPDRPRYVNLDDYTDLSTSLDVEVVEGPAALSLLIDIYMDGFHNGSLSTLVTATSAPERVARHAVEHLISGMRHDPAVMDTIQAIVEGRLAGRTDPTVHPITVTPRCDHHQGGAA